MASSSTAFLLGLVEIEGSPFARSEKLPLLESGRLRDSAVR